MKMICWATLIPLVLGLAGCAGGWKNGPPSQSVAASPTAAKAAPAAAAPTGAVGGTTFTWSGEGQTVHVAGDFNDWSTTADPLKKQADGTWTLTKNLPAGRYAYKFVIDGGTWKEDPNATETVDDGYGGKNSLVVVTGGTGGNAAAAAAVGATATGAAASGSGDGVTFVWNGEGNSVNVAGEFNDWSTTADPLTKQADGTWSLTKKLAPGRYAYKFVIDGNTWKEDPNATETVDDGYGGKNSLVVVGAGGAGSGSSGGAAGAAAAGAAAGAAASRPPAVTAEGVTFFFAGNHQSVHLAGDFNDWSTTADPLTKGDDGLWTITRKLEPGTHGYKFVVDGSKWQTDPANPETVDDGFGGKNSIIEVK